MIISAEQTQAALDYLRDGACDGTGRRLSVPTAVLDQARAAAQSAPDVRAERVEEARTRLRDHDLDARDIAEKMVSRIISDSLR